MSTVPQTDSNSNKKSWRSNMRPGWAKGRIPESWCCIDCNVNTAPGFTNRVEAERTFAAGALWASGEAHTTETVTPHSEVYTVLHKSVWQQAGMKTWGGCLCIGCLEKRLGRQLRPKDFIRRHPFNKMPGTVRLMSRREEYGIINHADGLFANCGGNPNPVKTMEEALEVIRKWLESSYAKDDGLDIPASLRREAAS